MGQKTATLVTYITKKGTRKNKVYHCQWGIGRIQPMTIMTGFFDFILKREYDSERKDIILSGGGMYDETKYMREEIPDFDKLNFAKIKDVQKVYPQLDNDNGGMVFIVDDKRDKIKIGFLLDREEVGDEDAFKEFVSMYNWQEKVGGKYTDAWFMIMLHGFIQHFQIDILK